MTNLQPPGRAFLRWAGSKRKLLPKLLEKLPQSFDRYVEPFAGSACFFFALRPACALLADINTDLMDTYVEVKERVEDVIGRLRKLRRGEEHYYRLRKVQPEMLKGTERAARFIYLNRFCFNGLYRTNRDGRFNVPYGGERSGQLPTPQFLRECSAALSGVELQALPFEESLERVRAGDFVYLDPPYCIQSRRVFNEYSNAAFGPEQLSLLRDHLKRLDKMSVPFLVSYGYSKEALELGRGFHRTQALVQRQIAGFANQRRKARELFITNF